MAKSSTARWTRRPCGGHGNGADCRYLRTKRRKGFRMATIVDVYRSHAWYQVVRIRCRLSCKGSYGNGCEHPAWGAAFLMLHNHDVAVEGMRFDTIDSTAYEGPRESRECAGEILAGAADTSWHIEVALL